MHFTGPKKSTVQEGGLKSARRDEGSGAVVFVVGQGERERERERERDNDEESKEKERKRNQRSCRREGRITFMKRSTFLAAQQ